jgi:transcription initiation factor TFIIB
LPAIVQRAASDIGCKAAELDIVPERSSVSVAAAAIYMASNASDKKLTKKEISDVTGVTDVTIRQSYELMYPRAAELIPAEFELDIGQLPQS